NEPRCNACCRGTGDSHEQKARNTSAVAPLDQTVSQSVGPHQREAEHRSYEARGRPGNKRRKREHEQTAVAFIGAGNKLSVMVHEYGLPFWFGALAAERLTSVHARSKNNDSGLSKSVFAPAQHHAGPSILLGAWFGCFHPIRHSHRWQTRFEMVG